MTAGFAVITLRQSSDPPNGKVHTHWGWERRDRCDTKTRACSSFSLTSRGLFTRIHLNRLLWCFTVTAWKCVKTSPQTLATPEVVYASQQHWHFLFRLDQKQWSYQPPPILLTWHGPLWLFYVSLIEDKIEKTHFF
jgi:hypothetical protein